METLSKESAWQEANMIFPYDYEKDEQASVNAGYPIYRATSADHPNNWISDLGNTLEVNTEDGKSVRINIIPEDHCNNSSYAIYITDSYEVAHLIARGLRESTPWTRKGGKTVSIENGCVEKDCRIPEVYHGSDKFFALVEYRNGTDWKHPEYSLTIC